MGWWDIKRNAVIFAQRPKPPIVYNKGKNQALPVHTVNTREIPLTPITALASFKSNRNYVCKTPVISFVKRYTTAVATKRVIIGTNGFTVHFYN